MKLALTILAALTLAPTVYSQTVDFNTAGDLASQFAIAGAAGSFAQIASGGITGGAVSVQTNNASDTAIFLEGIPSRIGATPSISIFFKYDASLRDPSNSRAPVTLGFSRSTSVVNTYDYFQAAGLDVGVYLLTFTSNSNLYPNIFPVLFSGDSQSNVLPQVSTSSSEAALVSGDWYLLTLDASIVGGNFSQVTLSVTLSDCGADGTSAPIIVPNFGATASFNNVNVTQATQLFGGFRAMKDGGTALLDDFTVTPASSTHPLFFIGEAALDNGVYYLQLPTGNPFGYYSFLSDPGYVYHFDLGYEYVFDAGDAQRGIYLYDFTSNTFFYTSPAFSFPYLYDFSLNSVVYYYPDPNNAGHYNTNGIRYFYVFSTGKIISK